MDTTKGRLKFFRRPFRIRTSNVMDNQFLALIVQHVHIHIKQIFNIFSGKNVVRRTGHGDLSVFHGDDVVCVGGGLVDVVQDDDGGALVFTGQPLEQLHEGAGVVHIEVVERFVQEDVIGALAEDHGNHGALALSAGEFGQVAVGEAVQLELGKCVFDDGEVFGSRSALVVGITPEHEQVANCDSAHDAVFLGQDGERFCQLGGRRGRNIFAGVADAALLQRAEARHEREERGFAGAVGTDERGDAAFGDVEADIVEDGAAADVEADVADGNHDGFDVWICFQTTSEH